MRRLISRLRDAFKPHNHCRHPGCFNERANCVVIVCADHMPERNSSCIEPSSHGTGRGPGR